MRDKQDSQNKSQRIKAMTKTQIRAALKAKNPVSLIFRYNNNFPGGSGLVAGTITSFKHYKKVGSYSDFEVTFESGAVRRFSSMGCEVVAKSLPFQEKEW